MRETALRVAGAAVGFRRTSEPGLALAWTPYRLRRALPGQTGLRRRIILGALRALDRPPLGPAEVGSAADGSVVSLVGAARALRPGPGALWSAATGLVRGGAVTRERAYDFLLVGAADEPVRVVVAGGFLLDAAELRPEQGVVVTGTLDTVLDPSAPGSSRRAPPMRRILRSSEALPLLVRVRPS